MFLKIHINRIGDIIMNSQEIDIFRINYLEMEYLRSLIINLLVKESDRQLLSKLDTEIKEDNENGY